MIDFELDDALALVRETAREFAQDHLRPRERESEHARDVDASVRNTGQIQRLVMARHLVNRPSERGS